MTALVSVLLISWNTREETRRCLESLAHTDVAYEVIAVDNASRDGSAEVLAADPAVTLIRNASNVGFAAAVNQAYRAARGELILLLNSDVVVHPGTLARLVSFLADHPEAAGVSPLYLNPDGSFQQHYVQQPSFAASLALFTVLRRVPGFRGALHRFELRGQDFSRPRELASASCQLLRRPILPADHIFDESFPVYWNDAVLTMRLQAAGHRLWMIPDAAVTHTRGASCRLLGPALRFRHLLGGLVRYLRLTQPAYRLAIFRAVMVASYLVRTAAGRSTILGPADLLAALRGDLGALPDGDTRDWVIRVGGAATAPVGPADVRLVRVDPPGPRVHWRFRVVPEGTDVWRAGLPTALPLGRLAPVNWVNGRIGAACLRRWLDRRAGARILSVDAANRHLIGWLGEDVVSTVDIAAAELARV